MRAHYSKAFMHLQKRIVTANNAASKLSAANNRADLWYTTRSTFLKMFTCLE